MIDSPPTSHKRAPRVPAPSSQHLGPRLNRTGHCPVARSRNRRQGRQLETGDSLDADTGAETNNRLRSASTTPSVVASLRCLSHSRPDTEPGSGPTEPTNRPYSTMQHPPAKQESRKSSPAPCLRGGPAAGAAAGQASTGFENAPRPAARRDAYVPPREAAAQSAHGGRVTGLGAHRGQCLPRQDTQGPAGAVDYREDAVSVVRENLRTQQFSDRPGSRNRYGWVSSHHGHAGHRVGVVCSLLQICARGSTEKSRPYLRHATQQHQLGRAIRAERSGTARAVSRVGPAADRTGPTSPLPVTSGSASSSVRRLLHTMAISAVGGVGESDEDFDLGHHLRWSAVPAPGGDPSWSS